MVLCLLAASCSSGSGAGGESVSDIAETAPQLVEHDEWGPVFGESNVVGTIAIRQVGSPETHVWNRSRALERRRPASTFKILNSLIILETGVLENVDTIRPWDGVTRGVPAWNQDHSLRSGIDVSAVWLYQQLAREVGTESMTRWIEEAEYGNTTPGGEIDDFWLVGDLGISPVEQLDFLERLVTRELPFRPIVMDAVAEIIEQERGPGWSWSFKTGTALVEDPDLGWLVGSTEHDGDKWVFALNVDLATVDDLAGQIDPKVRQNIARTLLHLAGALPE